MVWGLICYFLFYFVGVFFLMCPVLRHTCCLCSFPTAVTVFVKPHFSVFIHVDFCIFILWTCLISASFLFGVLDHLPRTCDTIVSILSCCYPFLKCCCYECPSIFPSTPVLTDSPTSSVSLVSASLVSLVTTTTSLRTQWEGLSCCYSCCCSGQTPLQHKISVEFLTTLNHHISSAVIKVLFTLLMEVKVVILSFN